MRLRAESTGACHAFISINRVRKNKLTPAVVEAEALKDALLRDGILIGLGGTFGNVLRFQPPLVITKQQVDHAVNAFAAALQKVAQPATV